MDMSNLVPQKDIYRKRQIYTFLVKGIRLFLNLIFFEFWPSILHSSCLTKGFWLCVADVNICAFSKDEKLLMAASNLAGVGCTLYCWDIRHAKASAKVL